MSRRKYTYYKVKPIGGINQQDGLADSRTELADALNVYAPDGILRQRPGYWGVAVTRLNTTTFVSSSSDTTLKIVETPKGTFNETTTLSGLPAGDRFYIGFPVSLNLSSESFADLIGVTMSLLATNSNAASLMTEYWNGEQWVGLPHAKDESYGLGISGGEVWFPCPNDIATTTVDGSEESYFFRFTVVANDLVTTELDASTTLLGTTDWYYLESPSNLTRPYKSLGLFAAQFPSKKLYWQAVYIADDNDIRYVLNNALNNNDVEQERPVLEEPDGPTSFAVVPQFEELYASCDGEVTVHKAFPSASDTITATVESDPAFVGSGARYSPDLVPQLAAWPKAKYIEFFRGEFWAANIEGAPYSVRWSAPVPAYKVWPTLNQRTIMENDNSPTTAIKGFRETMHVFKNDSIWQMVDTGINAFQLQGYAARQVVRGVGCVAQGSIQEIRNHLVFLAEDGVYAFNGSSATKITEHPENKGDRLEKVIRRITPGRRPFAVSANWKAKNLYLLGISLDGSDTNNYVIVWDYKNDSWWLWDNIEAQAFLVDEDASDNEKVYFGDSKGRIYQLGVGNTDYGTVISSHIVTHDLGDDGWSRRLRSIELNSTNKSRSATVEVLRNDTPTGLGTSGTVTLTDSFEKDWGTLVFGTDQYTQERDRKKGLGFLESGDSFRVKVSHNTKNAEFTLNDMQIGMMPVGRRR